MGSRRASLSAAWRRWGQAIDEWSLPTVVLAVICAVFAWSLLTYLAIRAGLFSSGPQMRRFTDLYERYLDASNILHNGDLYELRVGASLNTNPPIQALIFIPFEMLGRSVGALAWTTLSVSAWVATAAICLRYLGALGTRSSAVVAAVLAPGLAIAISDPYRVMLLVGQLRLLLLLLVVVDLLAVRPARRGILIGLAAALSIVPFVFILLVGISAGRRAVGRCIAAAAGFSLFGMIAGASAWWRYYFVLLPTGEQVKRVLRHHPASDPGQSNLLSVFARPPLAHLPGHQLLFGILIAITIVGGTWLVVRLARAGFIVSATMSLGFVVTIIEPESWVHYWVWALLGPFAAWELLRWRRGAAWSTLLFLLPMLPLSRLIATKLGLIQPLASSYAVSALAFLVVMAVMVRRSDPRAGESLSA